MDRRRPIVAAVLLAGSTAFAQVARQPPRRSPELERLAYFVGHWNTDAEMKAGPYSPGGPFTSDDHTEWMTGGFFVTTRAESSTPNGQQSPAVGTRLRREAECLHLQLLQ